MARKQVNFRLEQETIEQLKLIMQEKNEVLKDTAEKYGISLSMKYTATDIIGLLIESGYKSILAEKYKMHERIAK